MSLNILTFSTLFPNPEQLRHGIFVETRLRHLCHDYPVKAEVIAPIPWFPSANERFGLYARYRRAPREQDRDGLRVSHPRYAVIPKVSWQIAPALLYAGARATALRRHQQQGFDLIDAHYFYPDGVAAILLGRALGVPVVITARGSDITVMPDFCLPRRMIMWAAEQSAAMITVSSALGDQLVRLGAKREKIRVLRNGVDLEKFTPGDRQPVREKFAVGDQRMLLSVGNLIELKGNHLTIAALPALDNTVLVLVGDGPERAQLQAQAASLGVSSRVHFVGTVAQHKLPEFYTAADALVLASRSEGWANVLLEGMACGCPAIASKVWGTPEVVAEPDAGVLMAERTPQALAAAVDELFANYPGRERTRAYAEKFDWGATSQGQYELMSEIAAG